jgi:hypothetical protein
MVLQQSDYLYSLRVLDTKKIKRKKPLLACIAIALIGAVIGPSTAHSYDPSIEAYKLYAHMKLLDDKAYRCLVKLWTLESHWNPKAANPKSSAYGIPQLLKMKERNPYKQIDLGLKYITHRYVNPCLALAHHKRVGHY